MSSISARLRCFTAAIATADNDASGLLSKFDFAGVVLPAAKQARLFGVGSPFACDGVDFLLSNKNKNVECWFATNGSGVLRFRLVGKWSALRDEVLRIEWEDKSGSKKNERAWISLSGNEEKPSRHAPVDYYGVLTRTIEDIEMRYLSDGRGLHQNVLKARKTVKSAYAHVAYAMCDDLLDQINALETKRASADVIEKAIAAFLAERGIAPV